MSSIDGAQIEITNWEKYNPRGETKRPNWFRFENDLALSEKLFDLTCEQRWMWVVVLSLLSRKNGETIVWNSKYVEGVTGITAKAQSQAVELFEKLFSLHVTRASDVRVTCEGRALRDGTGRNGTNDRRSRPEYPQAFEEVYGKYPKKEGKKNGFKLYAKLTLEEKAQVVTAVENYVRRKRADGMEDKYFKMFSTFMGEWADWLDPSAGTIQTSAPKLRVKTADEL